MVKVEYKINVHTQFSSEEDKPEL